MASQHEMAAARVPAAISPSIDTVDAVGTASAPAVDYRGFAPSVSPHTADATAAVRLAWRVTLAACAALVALVTGVPALQQWYVASAVVPRAATLTSIDGVVFVQRQGTGDWRMARPDEQVVPGDVLRTAANARGFLQLTGHSTALLFPNSTLRVLRAQQGRFHPERTAVVLELTQGRVRIGVAPPADPAESFFQLRTPGTEIHLEEGSYSADVSKEVTHVSVRIGQATAYTAHGQASAGRGQRIQVQPGRAPVGNVPARRDLVENGLFTQRGASGAGLAGWIERDLSEQDPAGTISLTRIPGAVTFERYGRGHGETLISQQLDVDLWDFEKLTLSANIRVLEHSLSGGGWLGREFPLMIRVIYRDNTGGQVPWYRGYYLHNADGFPVLDGERLPSTDWHRVEIDLLSLVPRPWRILRVEVVASGWDYVSAVNDFHLWAE